MMEYNTARNHLVIREYGRYIQRMVEYLLTIEDRAKRQQQAEMVVELMGFFNPQLKTIEDYKHKLWDHLFVISNFELDVDSPYPKPEREVYQAKPEPLPYPKRHPKYSHLGKNLELVINRAMEEADPEKKAGFAHAIAYYMKLSYSTWHKDLVHDDSIRAELDNITGGVLEFSNTPYIKHRATAAFEQEEYGRAPRRHQGFSNRGGGNNRNNNNRGGGNNRNNRDNRNGNVGGRDNRNRNFKKRF